MEKRVCLTPHYLFPSSLLFLRSHYLDCTRTLRIMLRTFLSILAIFDSLRATSQFKKLSKLCLQLVKRRILRNISFSAEWVVLPLKTLNHRVEKRVEKETGNVSEQFSVFFLFLLSLALTFSSYAGFLSAAVKSSERLHNERK